MSFNCKKMCNRKGKMAVLLFRSDVLTKEQAIGLSIFQGFLLTLNYSMKMHGFIHELFVLSFLKIFFKKTQAASKKEVLDRSTIEAYCVLLVNYFEKITMID